MQAYTMKSYVKASGESLQFWRTLSSENKLLNSYVA